MVETDRGLFLFEPELQTMIPVERDMCRLGQRRVKALATPGNSDMEGSIHYTAGHQSFVPLEEVEKSAFDRVRLAIYDAVADSRLVPITVAWNADSRHRVLSQKLTKSPQGPEARVVKPGLHFSAFAGENGKPWVADKEGVLPFGKVRKVFSVGNFQPDPNLVKKSALPPRTADERLIEDLADAARQRERGQS